MNEQEAQNAVRGVEALWRCDLKEDGRRIWREALMAYDKDVFGEALQRLAGRSRFAPTLAEMREMMRAVLVDRRERIAAIEPGPPARLPEWVAVWRWARTGREPAVHAPFPQQHPHHQPPYLSEREYGTLRDEWVAAGQPGLHATAAQVIA